MVVEALKRLLGAGAGSFGELSLRAEGTGVVISSPPGAAGTVSLAADPDALRDYVRFDDAGEYRPLTGAVGLRSGWTVRAASQEAAAALVEAVYPLALVHRAQEERGELRVVPLDEVLLRQSGRYEVTSSLGPAGRSAAQEVLCSRCVREPRWAGAHPAPGPGATIPCPEPCSVMVSLCREAAIWGDSPPPGAPIDAVVPFAAFDQPGNAVREDLLRLLRTL